MQYFRFLAISAIMVVAACSNPDSAPRSGELEYDPTLDSLRFSGEVHLRNVKQLTFGGNNAEAYFSSDDSELIFQSDWDAINTQGCDQQFRMRVDGRPYEDGLQYRLVSTGKGRTTCGYFLGDEQIVYASTHGGDAACPEYQPFAQGRYVWPVHTSYDIYASQSDGSGLQMLIGGEGYDAEATVSPDGKYIVFTSTRSGDIELWRYEVETGELLQLTDEIGYDGGAFFSPDSRRLVWRASRPTGEEAEIYKGLLAQDLVEPKALNLFVADADGSNARQVTELDGANWAPFFHPSGDRIIFATNHHTLVDGGREFDLFMVSVDGTGLERITHSGTFDAFAMFSYAGDKLVFASNRNKDRSPSRDTNVFIADWIETPDAVDKAF